MRDRPHFELLGWPILVLLASGCALRGPAPAVTNPGPRAVAAGNSIMASAIRDTTDRVPALAGAVGVGRQVVYSHAVGMADLERGQPAATSTRFRIYSASKPIGATAAMLLAESGKLDLDVPIARYLPDLPVHVGVVTVRQLLAHRGGIRHYREGEWDRVSATNCVGPREALPAFITDSLEFEPGSGYRYTTFGYVLLSAVIEAAAGVPFDEFVRERIFAPSGMTSTAIEGRPMAGSTVATFYDRAEDGSFSPTAGVDASCKFFGGGLISTAEDMVRFGLALLDGRLVSRASLSQMLQVHSADAKDLPPYGYGFFPGDDALITVFGVPREDYVPAWWHGGSGRGGYAVLIIYPDRGAAAAMVTNVRASGRLVRATHTIALPFLTP